MNVNSLHSEKTNRLALNEIGRVTLETGRPLAFDSYQKNRSTGAFILIDRLTNATVAAGMTVDRNPADKTLARRREAADAGSNLRHQQRSTISLAHRTQRIGQQPFVVWLTGLPRAGKSSIAFALEAALFERHVLAHVLDGERLRVGLSSDLGFSSQDRWEHQRRAAELGKLCCELGLISIIALVSPLAADRAQVRRIIGAEHFIEIHCDALLAICEERDQNGLYARARAGEIDNVTGIDAPYEAPNDPDLVLDTANYDVDSNIQTLLEMLHSKGLL